VLISLKSAGADMEQIKLMFQRAYACPHCGKPNLLKFTTIGGLFIADGLNEETGEMIRHVCEPEKP
jgi:hypothetical protein